MHIVIFEGWRWNRFAPLALSRPVFTLATGMSTLIEKQLRYLEPSRLSLWVRPEMVDYCQNRLLPKLPMPATVNQPLDDQPALLVNGRTVHLTRFEHPHQLCIDLDELELVRSAYVQSPGLSPEDVLGRSQRWQDLRDLPRTMPQTRLANSLCDLIGWNEESLVADWSRLREMPHPRPAGPFHLVNESDVWLEEGVSLQPGCVLDATRGPIYVGDHASIGANAVVHGPCFIGRYCQIMPQTFIKAGTSIGMMSKVGGEISNSILLGYTNKVHYGYVGDSYVGNWVNLGAGTTTSNMKNTYGEVHTRIEGKEVCSGRHFLGSLIGDHVKTAVQSVFKAGSYVGFCGMVGRGDHLPRYIPSYSFLTEEGDQPYMLDKAIEVTRRVFARRDRAWTPLDENIMRYIATIAPTFER
jgi:UDP-N-acetylglucosamine diphosphorylase/glucosamine-1-phosphate N-acetyltransferase